MRVMRVMLVETEQLNSRFRFLGNLVKGTSRSALRYRGNRRRGACSVYVLLVF